MLSCILPAVLIMKQLFFFIFLSLSAMYSICQSTKRVDSLTQITKYSKNDTIVVNSYLKLYEEFEYIDIDSAIFYCINALDLSRSIKNKKLEGYSLYYLGGLYEEEIFRFFGGFICFRINLCLFKHSKV